MNLRSMAEIFTLFATLAINRFGIHCIIFPFPILFNRIQIRFDDLQKRFAVFLSFDLTDARYV